MKRILGILLVLFLLNSGCSILLEDQGETGIRYGAEITFFSRASATNAASSATMDVDSLVSHIVELQGTEPESEADTETEDGG